LNRPESNTRPLDSDGRADVAERLLVEVRRLFTGGDADCDPEEAPAAAAGARRSDS
jgi:hypothetical protein